MSEFELPENFSQLVHEKYQQALSTGDVVFQESTNHYIEDNDVQFVITHAPGLAKKPTQEKAPEQEQREEGFNPFLNPDPKLTVLSGFGNGEFNILLNKYPITENHLLLTTTEFKSQNSPLSPRELIASIKILDQLEKSSTKNEKFFGFYNCGENSGASQPHKHLQFLKFPDNFNPFVNGLTSNVEPFLATSIKEPLQSKDLPFAHFALPLKKKADELFDEEYLALAFSGLLQRALTILRDTELPIAYNVVFTKKWIYLVPRSKAYYEVEQGKLGLNAAGFIGLILAKNEELLKLIQNDGPTKILSELGFPNTAEEGTDEYHY
ncbi:5',5'''-P-1,P-4-tetraphosphate phosphorylase 2 [Wickerhamomyces ciferrii]|uniref:5',5'''-P-1,P-4-tetraphosphate phosphorylase 2 n=1 Tax=Wickerhamomyces ciferrii (strain ATCC 14091 / BCRC 22168 / CBS 111 / JCM 3599 / NBRC 0793 / NRRL Y-1031 F-60-10) TaxID=1206466 RepID=K0KW87_WICCF|nr:5',5'''-P-1,P-4-tetraphosphate phosphorylase 2 [Wickerhamomyces ciferrii]CCH45408.1 5',5'''-P-1,P-4-tetraphosphate phosphorylase 2 [Wickerhamomyces ciferrii]